MRLDVKSLVTVQVLLTDLVMTIRLRPCYVGLVQLPAGTAGMTSLTTLTILCVSLRSAAMRTVGELGLRLVRDNRLMVIARGLVELLVIIRTLAGFVIRLTFM